MLIAKVRFLLYGLQCSQNLFVTCAKVVHDIYLIGSQINIRIISDMNNFFDAFILNAQRVFYNYEL